MSTYSMPIERAPLDHSNFISIVTRTCTATDTTTGVVTGSVTFSSASYNELLMATWPMELDANVLNEVGGEVAGPVKFYIDD